MPASTAPIGLPPANPGLSPSLVLLLGVSLTFASCVVWMGLGEESASRSVLSVVCAVDALLMIFPLRAMGFAWQSGPVAYLVVLWMFHFPLTLMFCSGLDLRDVLPGYVLSWLETSAWYTALAYATLCANAFVLGCLAVARLPRRILPARRYFGCFCSGIGTAVFAIAILAGVILDGGGFDVFASSYGSLYFSVFGQAFGMATFLLTVGVILALLNAPRKLQWLPLAIQACVTTLILLTGARQFALVGALVVVVTAFKAGVRLKFPSLTIGTIVLLGVVSYVGATRSRGVIASGGTLELMNPKAALAETGGSLQTVGLFIGWTQSGDELLWGGSYWLPFERGMARVLPMLGRGELSRDPRAVSEVMLSRIGGMGGSAIAESYYNFGIMGCGYFAVIGFLLAWLALRAQSPVAIAFEGVVLYALLFQVRNWFLSVPATILLGGLPILVSLGLRSMVRRADT